MPFTITSGFATAALLLVCSFTLSSASPTTCSPSRGSGSIYPRDELNATVVEEAFSWDTIIPTANLEWHTCHAGKFQCARLEVPLDYSEPDGSKAAIALIRKRATVPEDSPAYRGPVLFNPGGPGLGGVNAVLQTGDTFAAILGPQFDIVGFDPRGIGASTPRATFFPSDVERALYFTSQTRVIRPGGSREGDLAKAWADAQILGGIAARVDDDNGGFLKYLNTEATATDMLGIARAHGREKVQYWGFSYGTVLGATFAAMYPDNVERMIIDGVMEPQDYYGTTWLSNLADIDKTLDVFYTTCAQAGPERCALSSPNPEDIRANVTALFDRVLKAPIPTWSADGTGDHAVVIDYSYLRGAFLSALYAPYALWAGLAKALKDLESGDGTAMLALFPPLVPTCACGYDEGEFKEVLEGYHAIHCNDGDEVPTSLDAFKEHFESLTRVSEWGDVWVNPRASCIGWPKMEKRFRGPFIGNTSHPLLVIGNTADPVTPLRSAKKVAEGFHGSVVLTQDSAGHGSLSAPSLCTQTYVHAYFVNGTLPDPGTVCETTVKNPFLFGQPPAQGAGVEAEAVSARALGGDDPKSDEVWNAISELAGKRLPFGLGNR